MSDLISRDVLIRDITEKIDISKAERAAAIKHGRYNDVYFYSGEICIARRIRRYVNMFAPTVDAEPVVRCKDCKHRGTCDCPMLQEIEFYDEDDGWDYRDIDNTDDDGFCHNGAKIDGGVSYEAD